MQKQDLDPLLMQKSSALWEILLPYTNRVNYLRDTAFKYFLKLSSNNLNFYYSYKGIDFKLVNTAYINLVTLLNEKELLSLEEQVEYLHKNLEELNVLKWYITRILNNADSLDTATKCIPSYVHKHIEFTYFLGKSTVDALYVEEYYSLLEEAPLHNVILGIQ